MTSKQLITLAHALGCRLQGSSLYKHFKCFRKYLNKGLTMIEIDLDPVNSKPIAISIYDRPDYSVCGKAFRLVFRDLEITLDNIYNKLSAFELIYGA